MHAAFTFAHESLVAKSSVAQARVPPGALISFLQKGLQYVEIESHLHEVRSRRAFVRTPSGAEHSARRVARADAACLVPCALLCALLCRTQTGKVIECDQPFSLVAPHICKAAQAAEDEDAEMSECRDRGWRFVVPACAQTSAFDVALHCCLHRARDVSRARVRCRCRRRRWRG